MSEVCTAFGSGAMPLNTIVDIMFPLSSLPVEGKKNLGTEDKARPGSQANNGLPGRGIGQRCCITGTTMREKRQGTMGECL